MKKKTEFINLGLEIGRDKLNAGNDSLKVVSFITGINSVRFTELNKTGFNFLQ